MLWETMEGTQCLKDDEVATRRIMAGGDWDQGGSQLPRTAESPVHSRKRQAGATVRCWGRA